MNLFVSTRTELLKTRRSSAFWLSVLGAAFLPTVFILMYLLRSAAFVPLLAQQPWENHFLRGWQSLAPFLLPMFVILSCSLVTQIEYKNLGWKQLFTTPQPVARIFLAKLLAIQGMILFCFLLFNMGMILSGLFVNLVNPHYTFFRHAIAWKELLRWDLKTYISVLGIAGFQYWLSLRFRNFIVPIAIGLALLILSLALLQWEHIYKMPYAAPVLTFLSIRNKVPGLIQHHEWNTIGYFLTFTLLAYLDLLFRREKG